MKHFSTSGKLHPRTLRVLNSIGWHVAIAPLERAFYKDFAALDASSVQLRWWCMEDATDEGNPIGECLFLEVGDHAHSIMDFGMVRARKIALLVRAAILESQQLYEQKEFEYAEKTSKE